MDEVKREAIRDLCPDGPIFFDTPEYDVAIIGATTAGSVVYDFQKMVECFMSREKVPYSDAVAFIEQCAIQSCAAMETAPTVIYRLETGEEGMEW